MILLVKKRKLMIVLSFDIGIKNFSFSLVDFNANNKCKNYNILYMENSDLCPNIKINKKFVLDQPFLKKFHEYLKTKHYIFENANICLIEKQLAKKNFKASKLFDQLQAHLFIFFPKLRVVGFSPKKKYIFLSTEESSSTYRERKNWGIEFSKRALTLQKDEVALEWFNSFKKKDDIADCLICSWNYMIQYHSFSLKNLIDI